MPPSAPRGYRWIAGSPRVRASRSPAKAPGPSASPPPISSIRPLPRVRRLCP